MNILPINSYNLQNTNKNKIKNVQFNGTLCKTNKVHHLKNHQSIFKKAQRLMTKIVWNPKFKGNLNFLTRNINSLRFMDPDMQANSNSIALSVDILNSYSKNIEYSNFVKEGIAFFQRNKGNQELYHATDNLYHQTCVDAGGEDVIRFMWMAYTNAVSKNIPFNEVTLSIGIKEAREYMNTFTEKGEILYPDGLPCLKQIRDWQKGH